MQGVKVRASYTLGRLSTTDLYPQPMEVLYVGPQGAGEEGVGDRGQGKKGWGQGTGCREG